MIINNVSQLQNNEQPQADLAVLQQLENTYAAVLRNKPNDKTAKDRHYTIIKTELSEAIAYYKTWVVDEYGSKPRK